MARRFARIDLADNAPDFRPIALEPGVPMLDTANASGKILLRWLGHLAAEPEIEGDSVNFYVRTDEGGRLEDVACSPATEEDLRGPLAAELEKIEERLNAAKAENSTERLLLRVLKENFEDLAHNKARSDRASYFFRYQDVLNRPRLVWCWGYQRNDRQPAPALLCAEEGCNLLWIRRPGQSAKCPACQAALPQKPKQKSRKRPLALLLLLLLLALIGGWLAWNQRRLIARPGDWTGPLGGRLEFSIIRPGLFGLGERHITGQAVALADDPRIVRLDPHGATAVAQSPGKTLIRFYDGRRTARVSVTVTEPGPPDRISIDPPRVELGVGTTAQVRLLGHYPGSATADLSSLAEWAPSGDQVVYVDQGLLEGLAPGRSTLVASLPVRQAAAPPADADADPAVRQAADGAWYRIARLEATANVLVRDIPLTSIEAAVVPPDIPVGRSSRLKIDAIADDGKRYSLLGSSRLALGVNPSPVATPHIHTIQGDRVGRAELSASFDHGALAGAARFSVVPTCAVRSLIVAPESIAMAVGEVAELGIAAPGPAPVELASSDPAVVEVTEDNRLVGRAEGSAQVAVRQGAESRTVQVAVRNEDLRAIEIAPSRIVVPVDHEREVRVYGRLADGRRLELAPEAIETEALPSPRYADFDRRAMALLGRAPTGAGPPQSLALRCGALANAAPVDVVVAPHGVELTPAGPVELPLGQMLSLDAWANYAGSRRVQLPPERLQWECRPAAPDPPGLELRGHKLAALAADSGAIKVRAADFGRWSNQVEVRSVGPEDVTLRLQLDRKLRLVGEPGTLRIDGTGPRGDVELVPELAQLQSGPPEIVAVEPGSDRLLATGPGATTITATHPATQSPASLDLVVVEPAKARLVFEPAAVRIAVDETAALRLYLEGLHDEKVERAEMSGPGVGYSLQQPEAVVWRPPVLVGRVAAEPFELAATYLPYLARPAAAKIEVVAPESPSEMRITPAAASLAAGQSVSLKVEAQWPGLEGWREVRPDAVAWDVPSELRWWPAAGGLRPAVGLGPAGGGGRLHAEFQGRRAAMDIAAVQAALDPADLAVTLELAREPVGRYLFVGQSQRYQVLLRKGEQQEPAAEVAWPPDFENQLVRWRAPVLTAKQAGHQQWLTARCGGRAIRFDTVAIEPRSASALPSRRPDQPIEVRVLSDQGPGVALPVGAEFDDFRVEAEYADGFVRIVTRKATIRLGENQLRGPVSFAGGRIIGVEPGRALVEAEFDGVASKGGLQVTVTDKLDIDEIRIAPELVNILPGETVGLDVIGYKSGRSVGRITGIAGVQWSASNAQVAQLSGSSVRGLNRGESAVTAQFGAITSRPAAIRVVDSLAEALTVDQESIEIVVGESRRIGVDLGVFRGEVDFSRSARVTSALPGVVRYDPLTHSLVGVSPGAAAVTFAWGDKLATTSVRVLPVGAVHGRIVVEPASGVLSPGQALDLRVYVLTGDGRRIDRTASCLLSSSAPQTVSIAGNLACAQTTGEAEITAQLPESATPGKAHVTVNSGPITEISVEPARLAMSVGDLAQLRVVGRSASGAELLFPQPDLAVSVTGPDPQAVRIVGAEQVQAISPGEAGLAVTYQGRAAARVPVTVTDPPWTGLVLDPLRAAIHPGQGVVYQASALRGAERRVVTENDGLGLYVSDPAVARVVGNMAVEGVVAGRTAVVARLGSQSAEAALDVLAGWGPPGRAVLHSGRRAIVGPGYGYFGSDWVVRGGPGYVLGDVERPASHAAGTGLQFSPDVLRIGAGSPGAAVRVLQVFADGSSIDVSGDPALEFTQPHQVARLEKTPAGPVFRPVRPGQTRVAARLGTLITIPELLIEVGDYGAAAGRLEVIPQTLDLVEGEVGGFRSVQVHPGAGQAPFEVDYAVEIPAGQTVVGASGDGRLRGLAGGTARVVVSARVPGTAHDGLSTVAHVEVSGLELAIEPARVTLGVGEAAPPLIVYASQAGGARYPVAAELESMDRSVLAPAAAGFRAEGLGATQVRATYRGREAAAEVMVTGERFLNVATTLDSGASDFAVQIEVLAAASEGRLEYRVVGAGGNAATEWVSATLKSGQQRVVLASPRIPYRDRTARYSVILEARPQAGGSTQRYPFTFRLESRIVEDRPKR